MDAVKGFGRRQKRERTPERWQPRAEELEPRQLLSSYHFDFGPVSAPAVPGYVAASAAAYSTQKGYGWLTTTGLSAQEQGSSQSLTSNYVAGTANTFVVNLPNGYYDVMPTFGAAHSSQNVSLWAQGVPLANLRTSPGQYLRPTYRIQVTSGQLALRMASAPGTTFALGGLDINVGSGIFEHMNWKQMMEHPTANISDPQVAGAEIHLPWSMLEPSKGQFNYQLLDRFLAAWGAVGKKIVLSIKTSPDGAEVNPYGGSSTPQWVYAEGARHIKVDKKGIIQKIPLLWDPIFQKEYQTFIQQFAARYDGNPAIEYIIVGPGVFNSTRAIYPHDVTKLRRAGYTDQLWYQTNVQIMNFYQQAFHSTHLALGMAPFTSEGNQGVSYNEFNLARLAAQKGMYIDYHNLRGTSDWAHSTYPQFFASLGTSTKIALGMDNPTTASSRMKQIYGEPMQIVHNAFGGVSGTGPINTYYLEFYLNDVNAANRANPNFQSDYAGAFSLAVANLRTRDKKW
jgi:hypothetical protein